MAGVGILMMGVGGWQAIVQRMDQDSVVEISSQEQSEPEPIVGLIVIDVGGAVEKPGVYELPAGSRVNDALMKAGGLASNADRAYVSRNLNLAQKLIDGNKLYIPSKDDPNVNQVTGEYQQDGKAGVLGESSSTDREIHLNTATVSELDELWGVLKARAQQIIENRPYNSLDEIVTRAKLPQSVLDNNAGIIQL
jgi:competence protein ComEA